MDHLLTEIAFRGRKRLLSLDPESVTTPRAAAAKSLI